MRRAVLFLLALGGCAAAPRPYVPTLGRAPASPYERAVGIEEGGERGAELPRVPGWSDERHAEQLARHVGLDPASIAVRPDRVLLAGASRDAQAARRYLADRDRFAASFVRIEARCEQLRVEDLPRIDGLWPVGGGIAATVATDQARLLEWLERGAHRRRKHWTPAVTLLDAQSGEVSCVVQRAYVAGAGQAVAGPVDPLVELIEEGVRLTVVPLLSGEGDLLVLDLQLGNRAVDDLHPGPPIRQWDRPEEAHDLQLTELPCAGVARAEVQVALGAGQSLVLFRGRAGGTVDVTTLGWTRDGR